MMKSMRAALAAISLIASAAGAQQRRGWEFGLDAGLFQTSFGGSSTRFELPIRAVRAAVTVGNNVAFEPVVNITRSSAGNSTASNFALDLALVANLSPDRRATQWFIRPFVGYQQSSNNGLIGGRSSLGIGTGLRVAVTDRVSMRYEGRYRYLPERNNVSGNEIGFLAGLSLFTR